MAAETPSWLPRAYDLEYFVAPGEVVVVAAIGVPGFANLPDYSSASDYSVLTVINGDLVWQQPAGSGSGGASLLGQLLDVTLLDLANQDILVYDAGLGEWTNRTFYGVAVSVFPDLANLPSLVADVALLQTNFSQHLTAINPHNITPDMIGAAPVNHTHAVIDGGVW